MIFRYKFKVLSLVMTILMVCGCDDFLDVESESQKVVTQSFTTLSELKSATAYLYGKPWSEFTNSRMYLLGDGRANNVISNTVSSPYVTYCSRGETGATSGLNQAWDALYVVITQADYVINNYAPITAQHVNEADVNACVGEARFIRALAYWYLAMFWHDVPIIEDPEARVENPLTPANRFEDVIQYAIYDLEYAAEWLPETDGAGRLTKYSAQGMLTRIYLTAAAFARGNHFTDSYLRRNEAADNTALATAYYGKAKAAALDVIDNGAQYDLMEDYEDIFKVEHNDNKEVLFAWQPVPGVGVSGLGNGNQDSFAYSTGFTEGLNAWGGSLFASFDVVHLSILDGGKSRQRGNFFFRNDKYSYLSFLKETAFSGTKCNFKKQVVGSNSDTGGIALNGNSGLKTPMLRMADVYLMYTEACMGMADVLTDDSELGLTYYNKVRERAFYINPEAFTKKSTVTANELLIERRLEFFLEGLFYPDLKRRSFYDMDFVVKYMNNEFGQAAIDEGSLSSCTLVYFIAQHYTCNSDGRFSSDSPRPQIGGIGIQTAVHEVAPGDYIHSNTAKDNIWSLVYPETELSMNPELRDEPIAYDFSNLN